MSRPLLTVLSCLALLAAPPAGADPRRDADRIFPPWQGAPTLRLGIRAWSSRFTRRITSRTSTATRRMLD